MYFSEGVIVENLHEWFWEEHTPSLLRAKERGQIRVFNALSTTYLSTKDEKIPWITLAMLCNYNHYKQSNKTMFLLHGLF